MKVYIREPSPCTSGYNPILIYSELMEKRKEKVKVAFTFFDNIQNKRYIKSIFIKLLEFFKIKEIGQWEEETLVQISTEGYVYFIQNGNEDIIKIGWSIDPLSRLKTLQTGSPHPLLIIAVQSASDRSLEHFLHKKFKKQHIKGEWFTYGKELKNYIKTAPNIFTL